MDVAQTENLGDMHVPPGTPPPQGSYAYESILLFLTTNSPLCYYNYRNRDIIVLTKMFANLMVVNGYFVKVYLEYKGIAKYYTQATYILIVVVRIC